MDSFTDGYLLNSPEDVPIELHYIECGQSCHVSPYFNAIILPLNGCCFIKSGQCPDIVLSADKIYFKPIGTELIIGTILSFRFLLLYIDPEVTLSGVINSDIQFSALSVCSPPGKDQRGRLSVNSSLHYFASHLLYLLENGFPTREFLLLKVSELLMTIGSSYPPDELALFFSESINEDSRFASKIFLNWHSVKTVNELAAISNYSLAAFGKKFKRVFGISPLRWLNERRAAALYASLTRTDKSLKEIAEECNLNSVQQLNEFCNKLLGAPPGAIRRRRKTVKTF